MQLVAGKAPNWNHASSSQKKNRTMQADEPQTGGPHRPFNVHTSRDRPLPPPLLLRYHGSKKFKHGRAFPSPPPPPPPPSPSVRPRSPTQSVPPRRCRAAPPPAARRRPRRPSAPRWWLRRAPAWWGRRRRRPTSGPRSATSPTSASREVGEGGPVDPGRSRPHRRAPPPRYAFVPLGCSQDMDSMSFFRIGFGSDSY
jgi:hypothetical protein